MLRSVKTCSHTNPLSIVLRDVKQNTISIIFLGCCLTISCTRLFKFALKQTHLILLFESVYKKIEKISYIYRLFILSIQISFKARRKKKKKFYVLMDVLENMEKISIKLPSCGFSFEVSFFPEHFVKKKNKNIISLPRQLNGFKF